MKTVNLEPNHNKCLSYERCASNAPAMLRTFRLTRKELNDVTAFKVVRTTRSSNRHLALIRAEEMVILSSLLC